MSFLSIKSEGEKETPQSALVYFKLFDSFTSRLPPPPLLPQLPFEYWCIPHATEKRGINLIYAHVGRKNW